MPKRPKRRNAFTGSSTQYDMEALQPCPRAWSYRYPYKLFMLIKSPEAMDCPLRRGARLSGQRCSDRPGALYMLACCMPVRTSMCCVRTDCPVVLSCAVLCSNTL